MRSPAAVPFLLAGLLVAGCSGPSGANPNPPGEVSKPSALKSFNPCEVFTPEDLRPFGVTKPGEPADQGVGEPGCDYYADSFLLTVYKDEDGDLNYWRERRDNFAVFEENQVGSRQGIKGVTKGSEGLGMCRQIMAAAGGSVSVALKYNADEKAGKDPCAKAMEFAEMIEPRLPG